MTQFSSPAATGTAPAVPVAATASDNDPNTAAAIQLLAAAVATLSQGPAASPPVPTPVVDAPLVPAAPATPLPTSAAVQFHTHGPWVVKNLYIVVPTAPLMAIVEDDEEGKLWYSITRGRFVGITLSSAIATNSTTGVPAGAQKGYKTQAAALAAFNELLAFNMVSVVP